MPKNMHLLLCLSVLLTVDVAHAYYAPAQGRWLSRDPIEEEGFFQTYKQELIRTTDGMPWSPLYQFAGNTPVNDYDYLGLVCGPDWLDWLIPDCPGGFDFTAACQGHDDCYYEECGYGDPKHKEKCDTQFLKDMLAVCDKQPERERAWCWKRRPPHHTPHRKRCWKYPRSQCRGCAELYYWAVDVLGDAAYKRDQEHACASSECTHP